MCELFAVSSQRPARVRLQFRRFAEHGAPREQNPNGQPDGWGAAYFDGPDAHVLREPMPAVRSAFVRVLEHHDFHSPLVLAHIRRASRGPVRLCNTQPFAREMAARMHVFAHNGDLPDVQQAWPLPPGCAQPIGQTDSEHVFCQLLRALAPLWTASEPPPLEARLGVVEDFARRMREYGPANFLYSDGDAVFAHAHRRRQEDGVVRPPGLYLLERDAARVHEHETSGLQVHSDHVEKHALSMLASVPVGPGDWQALEPGVVLVLRAGLRVA